MKTLKIFLLSAPVLLSGGCNCKQRFVPVGNGALALDTKTGQQCWAGPKDVMFKAPNHPDQPYCVDLANQK
jgi:hypothetical protein